MFVYEIDCVSERCGGGVSAGVHHNRALGQDLPGGEAKVFTFTVLEQLGEDAILGAWISESFLGVVVDDVFVIGTRCFVRVPGQNTFLSRAV
jgi:hypothetical protein